MERFPPGSDPADLNGHGHEEEEWVETLARSVAHLAHRACWSWGLKPWDGKPSALRVAGPQRRLNCATAPVCHCGEEYTRTVPEGSREPVG